MQVVKLPTTTVTRLPSPFDENELKLWNVEFWQLKKTIFSLFKHAHLTHTRKRKRKRNLIVKEKEHSSISTSLELRH